ncbi:MAG: DUF3820 family protein, partial [Acidobacteria bacterium]|nr:DUF3820 family protein [Acidobacteriota bacterium]
MTMPFGKHRGDDLRDVPTAYFDWLLANIPLREPLLSAVEDELRARAPRTGAARPPGISLSVATADLPLVREIVDRGYRAAAQVYHPDTGGDPNVMRQLNL